MASQTQATATAKQGYRVLVAVGLVSYGIVHLLLAWIALKVAFGDRGDASNQGALKQVAAQPFGQVLLVVMGIGLFALVVWQLLDAFLNLHQVDFSGVDEAKREAKERGKAIARAVVYLALGISAVKVAFGSTSKSGQAEQSFTAQLLSVPFGRVLVVVVGLVIVAVGVSQIVKGVKRKFVEDLRGGTSRPVLALGTVGYTAKGVALAVIGILFGLAAVTADADQAGGMDEALTTISQQPFGTFLLVLIAAGIAAFGLFCFAWARYAKS